MGPQQMTIACPPGTTFLDGALSYENSIKAECGPRQYRYVLVWLYLYLHLQFWCSWLRFTVKSNAGKVLAEEVSNDKFGCGECHIMNVPL